MKHSDLKKRTSNQCRTAASSVATGTKKKKSTAQGLWIAGTSLALLFGIAFLKGRADEPQGNREQDYQGE